MSSSEYIEFHERIEFEVNLIAFAIQIGTSLAFMYFNSKLCSVNGDGNEPEENGNEPEENVPWDSFGFGLNGSVEYMWVDKVNSKKMTYSKDYIECLKPTEKLLLHPASTVLNYGQSLFEGLKAFRRVDGKIVLFRPDRNAERISNGATRLLIPPVPESTFVTACNDLVRENSKWVPPYGKGALYLRPLLFGSGAALGVKPSLETTFCIFCSPVGDYFKKEGGPSPIKLQAVRSYSRAAPGGVGAVKAAGNYAPCFLVQKEVRERGYDEALFVDCVTGEGIEEAGASNFFAVFPNKKIITPGLGTILPGITRDTVIELAKREFGYSVEERRLTLDELKNATEAFCCGTGASITPVGSINIFEEEDEIKSQSQNILFGDSEHMGEFTRSMRDLLLSIQMGTAKIETQEKYSEWIHYIV